jgi:hypothetical protein
LGQGPFTEEGNAESNSLVVLARRNQYFRVGSDSVWLQSAFSQIGGLEFHGRLARPDCFFLLLLRPQVRRGIGRTRGHGWIWTGDNGLSLDSIAESPDWRRSNRIHVDERRRFFDVFRRETSTEKDLAKDSDCGRRFRFDECSTEDRIQSNKLCERVHFLHCGDSGSMALLIPPSWRRETFQVSGQAQTKNKFWYMFNRLVAGVGSFLIVLAISRTTPSLVQSISGIRYGTIFIAAYLISRFRPSWFREDFTGWALIAKIAGTCLVIAGLTLAGLDGGSNGQASP